MPRVPFDELPAHGRLWVFPASRSLSGAERQALLDDVDGFLDAWAAHGVPLRAGRAWVEDRFLLVGADPDATEPSGCSIDALVREVTALGERCGSTFDEHGLVYYRGDDGSVRAVARSAFRQLAAAGGVTAEVEVFDTSVTRVGDAPGGRLGRPAHETWHGKAFFGERAPA